MRVILPLALIVAGAVTLAACQPPGPPATTGASDFADLCAPCHGATGVGDGELAGDLEIRPADLTGLADRNGGAFPLARVMSKIWGYAKGEAAPSMMPEFGPLLESPTVLVDVGDGVQTPTPERLIDLGEYLQSIQK